MELFKVPYRDKMFGPFWGYMDKAMDALNLQQKAIASNIANAQNSNYHPVHVNFQNELQNYLHHMLAGSPYEDEGSDDFQIKLNFDPEFHVEGQGDEGPEITRDPVAHVDVNHEMAQLAKAQLLYGLVVDETKLGWSKYAIETLTK